MDWLAGQEQAWLMKLYGYKEGWGQLGADLARDLTDLMAPGRPRPETRSIEKGEGGKPIGHDTPPTTGIS